MDELKEAPLPLRMKELRPYKPGTYREKGFETPTGKLELYSEVIASLGEQRPDLNPLPVYQDSFDASSREEYPLTLIAGARIPNAIHSRLHELPWTRSLRQKPTADIHVQDAKALGIREGDEIELSTAYGMIRVAAHLTQTSLRGMCICITDTRKQTSTA